eukprot:TRINITY_DN1868_c4_g1_i1.p1 TRINITY_DN1868_c4_g1~~TRINITY_DN1868_c4_g1_i1.p1  ORF type:complete len:567 (+),score=135.67 TRINITY_DN1868_c4_g1_i1:33-1703(+)
MPVTDEDVQAALDSGEWAEKTDKKSGKTYYVKKGTKERCWDLKKQLAKEAGGGGGGDKKAAKDDGKEKKPAAKKEKAAEKDTAAKKPPAKAAKKKKDEAEDEPQEAAEGGDEKKEAKKAPNRPKSNSVVSNMSNVSRASRAISEIHPYSVTVTKSDKPDQGKYMASVTLESKEPGGLPLDGPQTIYGNTEKEVHLAAALCREKMRQKYYDNVSVRDYVQGGNTKPQVVETADYWDGDILHGGGVNGCNQIYNPPSTSSYGDDYYQPADTGRSNTLRTAAACGDVPTVRQCLLHGSSRIDDPRGDGKTALHHAARYGHCDIIDILLEGGANPQATDNKGRTPMDLAAQYGQRTAVTRLETRGCGSPGRLRHHWNCDGNNLLGTRSLSPTVGGAQPRIEYPPSHDVRRQLTSDVNHAMNGVRTLVSGWIRDWGSNPYPPPSHYDPYAGRVTASPQRAESGRISPIRRGGSPIRGVSPSAVDDLTARIWEAAKASHSQQTPRRYTASPVPTAMAQPPPPFATTPVRKWGSAQRSTSPPPSSYPNPTGNRFLLPTEGINI